MRISIILAVFSLIETFPLCTFGKKSSIFADRLFRDRDYYRAITEYKRFSYFSNESGQKRRASFKIGECYRKSGRPEKGIPYLLGAARFNPPDALTDSCSFSLAKSWMKLSQYEMARQMLDSLQSEEDSTRAVLEAWSYFLEGDFQNARSSFLSAESSGNATRLAELAVEGEELRTKSPRAASVMSAVLPGAGQIYAGAYKQGFVSMALHGLTGYLLYRSIVDQRYFEAAAAFYTGFSRFYVGNIASASRLAGEHNEAQRFKLVEEARSMYGDDLE